MREGGKMEDIGTSVIVILVTAQVITGIFLFTNKTKKANDEALAKLAEQHDWGYEQIAENLAWGSKFSGKNWELITESRSIGQESDSGSSNIHQTTIWRAELPLPARYSFWVGPRLAGGSTFSMSFASQIAGMLGSSKMPPANLVEMDSGILDLSKRYVLLAAPDMDPAVIRMSTVPRNLLEWTDDFRPLVIVTSNSVEITINNQQLKKQLEIERLVKLGEAVLSIVQ